MLGNYAPFGLIDGIGYVTTELTKKLAKKQQVTTRGTCYPGEEKHIQGTEIHAKNWQQEAERPGETNARMPGYRNFIP